MAPKKNLVSRKKVYRKKSKGKRTMKKRNMKGGGPAMGAYIAVTKVLPSLYNLAKKGVYSLDRRILLTKTAEIKYNTAQNNDLNELLNKIDKVQLENISPKDNEKLNSIKEFIEKLKAKIPEPEDNATEGPIIKVRKWKRFVVPILDQFIGDKSKYNFQYENQSLEEIMTPQQIEAEETEALKLQQEATAEIEAENRAAVAPGATPGAEGAAPGDMPGKVAAFCLCFEGSNPNTVLEALKKKNIEPAKGKAPRVFSNPMYDKLGPASKSAAQDPTQSLGLSPVDTSTDPEKLNPVVATTKETPFPEEKATTGKALPAPEPQTVDYPKDSRQTLKEYLEQPNVPTYNDGDSSNEKLKLALYYIYNNLKEDYSNYKEILLDEYKDKVNDSNIKLAFEKGKLKSIYINKIDDEKKANYKVGERDNLNAGDAFERIVGKKSRKNKRKNSKKSKSKKNRK